MLRIPASLLTAGGFRLWEVAVASPEAGSCEGEAMGAASWSVSTGETDAVLAGGRGAPKSGI